MPPRVLPWNAEIRLDGSAADSVMLLAGFGSGPETLRELAEHVRAATNGTVLVCSLARHTGNERAFHRSRSWHYFRDAERRFLEFWGEQGRPIHLGGYSTGALVALVVASRHPSKVAGLVMMSPALRVSKTANQLVGYAFGSIYYVALPAGLLASALVIAWHARRRGWTRQRRWFGELGSLAVFATAALGLRNMTVPLSDGGPMTRDGEEVLPPHFARAALASGSTLVPLQLVARWRLGRLSLPVCLVFGELDQVVDVRFGTLQAARHHHAELHIVPRAPHRVVGEAECHAIVADFVTRTRRDAVALRPADLDEEALPDTDLEQADMGPPSQP